MSARRHAALEARLGHEFADAAQLERALTHSSAVAPTRRVAQSYQRLEFLGDRVLGLAVADMLYRRLPNANEGDLSRSLNSLVRKESCAALARQLGLGAELQLGESELRSGGADKEAILGDVFEAVIGAVYIDGGYASARAMVERLLAPHIEAAASERLDAKTALQEWAQARALPTPRYAEIARSGPDHAPEFTIAVRLDGFPEARASGASKKLAEHRAAEAFLRRENIWSEASP